jgi:hypothetical protein
MEPQMRLDADMCQHVQSSGHFIYVLANNIKSSHISNLCVHKALPSLDS